MDIKTYISLHQAVFSYRRLIKSKLDQTGYRKLSPDHVMILFGLVDSGESTVSDLVYVGSNVSYNVARLHQAGYITYTQCSEDKRKVLVSITDKGVAVVNLLNKLLSNSKVESQAQAAIHSITKFQNTVLAEL